MARLTKEERNVFDPTLLIKNQKWKEKTIEDLLIGSRKSNINQPGESKAYSDEWKKEVDYTDPKKIPGEIKEIQGVIPGLEDLAHHGGWESYGKEAKDAWNRNRLEADVIKGLEEGTILPDDAAEMLQTDKEGLDSIINKFREQDQTQSLRINPQLASAKTPNQQAKSDVISLIKKLEKEGKYIEAQALYREQFGKV